jgi:hypothetical protein
MGASSEHTAGRLDQVGWGMEAARVLFDYENGLEPEGTPLLEQQGLVAELVLLVLVFGKGRL